MNWTRKGICIGITVLMLLAVGFLIIPAVVSFANVPDEILLIDGNSQTLELNLPFNMKLRSDTKDVIKFNGNSLEDQDVYGMNEPLTISSENTGTADVSIDLLGFIPVKNIKVTVVDEKYLIPGGQSIGVMLYTKGALVVGTMDVVTEDGQRVNPAKKAGLNPGDVIEKLNGVEIKNTQHMTELINNLNEEDVKLSIRRHNEEKEITITPVKDSEDGLLKLGVWVRDSTAGVGTLTFYDPFTKSFAGLGHAISDVDTGELLIVKEGEIVSSEIIEIVKGEAGEPGELKGSFDVNNEVIGNITKNTDFGIYGISEKGIENNLYSEALPAAKRDEIQLGDATLLCSLNNEGVKEYKCKIIKLNSQNSPKQKSMEIEITDERLLSQTGGIVQGMSGSPILQNGKIIGAVTHVFVNDPTKGYGIYVDWMLNELGK